VSIHKKNVLIIDDDVSIVKTFGRILQRNGFATDTALTGEEAIKKATANLYSIALIDVCLPDMNGTDLIFKLDDHGSKMVKIIITGFPAMAPKTDADAHLVKPVKPEELIALLRGKTEKEKFSQS
jgi:DNA-binding response OmpR family regulator